VSVTGSAQKVITSDVAKWRSSLSRSSDAAGLRDANAKLASDLAATLKFFREKGLEDKDVKVDPVMVSPVYANGGGGMYKGYPGDYGGIIQGYSLTQNIMVEAAKVDLITSIARDSSTLIERGVMFTSNPVEYYYSKLSDLKQEMLAEATKDARVRAGKIVESAGSNLGKLRSASMGVMQITPVNSTDVSDYGYYDTTSIEKQITAIVRASFAVQ
jgi:hypothetical protein